MERLAFTSLKDGDQTDLESLSKHATSPVWCLRGDSYSLGNDEVVTVAT